MYAVIKAGGKQQKVKAGDVIEVELVKGHEHGETMPLTPILIVDDDGVTHYGKGLSKAVVRAKLVGEEKGDKVRVLKYRPKTGYTRRQGHRQMYTLVEIEDVSLGGAAAQKAAPKKTGAQAESPSTEDVGQPPDGAPGGAAQEQPDDAAEEAPASVEESVEGASTEDGEASEDGA